MSTSFETPVRRDGYAAPDGLFASLSRLNAKNVELERINRQLSSQVRQMQRLVYLDPLTGLGNRRYFDGVVAAELRRATRAGNPLTLLICDVDRFKQWNDRYGHSLGDTILIEIAGVLKQFCRRGGDFAMRYAGDEFALLLPGMQLTAATQLAEKVRSAVAMLVLNHRRGALNDVTLSIGGATLETAKPFPPGRLIEAADQALYLAKRAGRNRTELTICDGRR
jgi:diguanylate cyclase (GGDEF)-like protein